MKKILEPHKAEISTLRGEIAQLEEELAAKGHELNSKVLHWEGLQREVAQIRRWFGDPTTEPMGQDLLDSTLRIAKAFDPFAR